MTPSKLKTLLIASIGNALEWYDFGLFGFFALLLQELFFPFSKNGLLFVFSFYALGLFMRPLGGIAFGYFGDRFGRKKTLVVSLVLMGIPTFFMGFLPTYEQVGISAVILLIFLRLMQGIAVGGEMVGSMTFLAEHASTTNRGLATSLIYSLGTIGGFLGVLSGMLLYYLLPQEEILAWGWRIPFIFGIFVAAVGVYLRLKLSETPLFLQLIAAQKTTRAPFREALKKHKREIFLIFLLAAFQAVGYNLFFVYLITWLIKEAAFTESSAFFLSTIAFFSLILAIPFCAYLSDRHGRRPIMMIGALASLLIVYPLMIALSRNSSFSYPLVFSAAIVFLLALATAFYQGPLAALMTELLSTKNRFMSLVLGYNISVSIFGGVTPFLCTYLIKEFNAIQAPALILMITGAIAFIVLLFAVKETSKLPLK